MAEHNTTAEPQHGEQPTVIVTEGRSGSSGGTWLIGIVLLIALVAGVMIFSRTSGSEAAKDNAIANAAGQVGDAAQKAGNAAQDAADNLQK